MSPSGRIGYIYCIYWTVWDSYMQVLYLGRALRTKETLSDFLKWRRVTRHPLVFRGLTGSQQTPGFGASHIQYVNMHILNQLQLHTCNSTHQPSPNLAHLIKSQSHLQWPTHTIIFHIIVTSC